jgi:hypothetical protein
MSDRMLDPDSDPFRPPAIPTEVGCLHCGQEYDSYLIEWRVETDDAGNQMGFWCCPTPGCGGRGFGFDIFPTDPDYRDEEGNKMWCDDDEGEDDEDFDEELLDDFGGEVDEPIPPTNGKEQRPPPIGEEDIPF